MHSSDRDNARYRARQSLVRVMADQARRDGIAVPNMREIERKAQEVGDRNDKKKDSGHEK